MHKDLSNKFKQTSGDKFTGWDSAIQTTEGLVQEAKERVKTLQRSIEAFKKMRDRGEPFPGESQNQSEASQ
jgi:hypothetical protein